MTEHAQAPTGGRHSDGEALNRPQAEAVAHTDGPLIVFAGAGSGKTRVITYRIARLIAHERVPPWEILAVTFTNKAAGEMRGRLDRMLGAELTRGLWIGTFHAVCARLLRRYHQRAGLRPGFVIYDESDQKAVMKRVLKDLDLDERRLPPARLLARIGREKQEGRGPDEMSLDDYLDPIVQRCYRAYQDRLSQANALDFDDLLLRALGIAEDPEGEDGRHLRHRYRHVLVDEFQDTNLVQYRLVRALSRERRNICVVGDDDQSIYRWRGADIRNIRGFTCDYPDALLVKLEQNYRSSGHIVAAALGVIRHAADRQPKELWTANEPGEPVTVACCASERDEAAYVVAGIEQRIARGVSPRELAVFYRVHAQSRVIEEVLRQQHVRYQIVGGVRFFDRAEVKDLLAYLRVAVNQDSDVDLVRIINVPPRKLGAKTVAELLAVSSQLGCSAFAAIGPLCTTDRVSAGAKRSLQGFVTMMGSLIRAAATAPPVELCEQVLADTGYSEWLRAQDTAEADARLDNLSELLGSVGEYEQERAEAGEEATLEDYLGRISLETAADALDDGPRVPLMTVHAAKGLEFDTVWLTGLEEGLFPLQRQAVEEEAGQLEEERRLAYVAITRARRELFVTHTATRTIYGQTRYNAPSPFLRDLPARCLRRTATAAERRTLGQDDLRDEAGEAEPPFVAGSARRARPDRRHRPTPTERYVEREPGSSDEGLECSDECASPFAEGAVVRHARFGLGTVLAVAPGADPTVTVKFEGWAPKQIKRRFLGPA